jgi:hypothetical protein
MHKENPSLFYTFSAMIFTFFDPVRSGMQVRTERTGLRADRRAAGVNLEEITI